MPEYVLAFILSAFLGGLGWLSRRIDQTSEKVEHLEVKMATDYVTKASLSKAMDRLEDYFRRIEDKLDAHITAEPTTAQLETLLKRYLVQKDD